MRHPLLLVIVALALAGCTAPDVAAPDGAAPADGAPAQLAFGLSECRYVIAWAPVDEAKLRALLPEGFEPGLNGVAPFVPVGAPYVAMEAFRCAETLGPAGTLEDVPYGSYYTSAVPPSHLAWPGAEAHFVKWDTLVADASLREPLAAAGVPARAGDVAVPDASPAQGATVSSRLVLDGLGEAGFEGVVGQTFGTGEGFPFAEYTPTEGGGVARWHAFATPGETVGTGQGVLRLPAGSWVADLVGADTVPARFITGTWTFSDGGVEPDARSE